MEGKPQVQSFATKKGFSYNYENKCLLFAAAETSHLSTKQNETSDYTTWRVFFRITLAHSFSPFTSWSWMVADKIDDTVFWEGVDVDINTSAVICHWQT